MSGDVFVCLTLVKRVGVSTGVECVEASNAAKYPIMHRTVLTTDNYPTQNANTAKVETA